MVAFPRVAAFLRWRIIGITAAIVLAVVAAVALWIRPPTPVAGEPVGTWVSAPTLGASASPTQSPAGSPSPSPSASRTAIPVPSARATLPVLDYFKRPPKGFPADTDLASTAPITQALHPTRKLALYDAPGGKALAYAAPTISGARLVMPIVAEQQGWRAVILPSANRTVGWLPPTGWQVVNLHEQLVVHLATHQLVWLRNGQVVGTWTVALGASSTPTPRGRTFVLARTSSPSKVYAGVDILALGAVPDHPEAVADGLFSAHTGIHAWYDPSVFGKNISNGCVRVPKAAQQQLIAVAPGTEVLITD